MNGKRGNQGTTEHGKTQSSNGGRIPFAPLLSVASLEAPRLDKIESIRVVA